MDIKVGNYVRCGTAGIKRVVEIIKEPKFFKVSHIKDEEGLLVNIGFITKVSEDRLGIIEKGDYVNGHLVEETNCKLEYIDDDSDTGVNEVYDGLLLEKAGFIYFNSEVKDILTKEQFEARKYVFKEELEYGQE